MTLITFNEFAQTHPLGKGGDWGRYTHYFTPEAGGVPVEGWADYRVKHFNSEFPVEFCSSQCDLLAAMQFWLERTPALAERLVIEQPLLIGTDFYVSPNHCHPTSLSEFDNVTNETYPPESPPELAVLRTAFREVQAKIIEPRDRFLSTILERELFPPHNDHTWFGYEYFSVMDITTTYAELDAWLDHPAWWAYPHEPAPPT